MSKNVAAHLVGVGNIGEALIWILLKMSQQIISSMFKGRRGFCESRSRVALRPLDGVAFVLGPSSSRIWAFVPDQPKEFTPATRGVSSTGQVMHSVGMTIGHALQRM